MGVIIILNLGIEEIVTITVATSEEREVEASSKKSNLRLIHRWNEEETFVDIEISRNFPFFVASLFVNIAWFERQTKPVFFSSRILPKITRYPMDWITDLISSGSERVEWSE